MSPHGGIYVEVKESIWPKTKPYEVGPFWSFLRGMMVYGFAKDIPDFMDIRKQTQEFQERTGLKIVPFFKIIGDADVYCFDDQGQVCRWEHETGATKVIGKSFEEVFSEELAELKRRKERKKAEKMNS